MKNLFFGIIVGAVLPLLLIATVAASRRPVVLNASTGIDYGTSIATGDGTVTNTFTFTFASPPTIFVTQLGSLLPPTNVIVAVTTSNFVLTTRAASRTNNWMAIGTP